MCFPSFLYAVYTWFDNLKLLHRGDGDRYDGEQFHCMCARHTGGHHFRCIRYVAVKEFQFTPIPEMSPYVYVDIQKSEESWNLKHFQSHVSEEAYSPGICKIFGDETCFLWILMVSSAGTHRHKEGLEIWVCASVG